MAAPLVVFDEVIGAATFTSLQGQQVVQGRPLVLRVGPVQADHHRAVGGDGLVEQTERLLLQREQDVGVGRQPRGGRQLRRAEVRTNMGGAAQVARLKKLGRLNIRERINEAVKSVPMAPLRAAYLRLRIYKNWGDMGWVSLRQLRAFKE